MKRRALSEVISTTILVAAMLVIVIGVMGFAFDLFNTQTQEAEFSQAQTSMVSLAQSLDTILPNPGSAAYVMFNTRTGGPDFLNNFGNLTTAITTNSTNFACDNRWKNLANGCSFSTNMSLFRYRAGSQVSYSGAQWLRAGNYTGYPFAQYFNDTLIVMNNTSPLSFVYIQHVNGSTWVVLDSRRIDVNALGIFNVSEGVSLNPNAPSDPSGNANYVGQYQAVNIIQIYLVRLLYGNSSGGGNIVVSVQNMNITRYTISIYPPNTKTGYYNIIISLCLDCGKQNIQPNKQVTLLVPITYNGMNVTTVINMYVINVRLTMVGG